jgi:GT2 family glycosyltransferase
LASNNMAVERSALLACGGFDERFTAAAEDRELCDRWRHRGGRLVYRPEAVIYHAHDLRLGSFVRQHRAYGRGAYAYHRVRAARGSGRMRDDLRFHAGLPVQLLSSARQVPVGSAARGAALAIVWQAVNAAGWAEAAATDRTQQLSERLPRRGAGGSPLGPPSA